MELTEEQEKKLEEVKMFTVAGLSLHRVISVNDVKWAIEEGFKKGILAEAQQKKEVKPNSSHRMAKQILKIKEGKERK